MDAGTTVALVLGSVGFVWGAGTFFVARRDAKRRDDRDRADVAALAKRNRDDELERRWLQEKRLIYAKVQAAHTAYIEAVRELANTRLGWRSGTPEEDLVAQIDAAWQPIKDAKAELDLMAPDFVRNAVGAASAELLSFGWSTQDRENPDESPETSFIDAVRGNAKALNAMRADLGLGPVDEYRAASKEEQDATDVAQLFT